MIVRRSPTIVAWSSTFDPVTHEQGPGVASDGMLPRMNELILAVESTSPPGDDLQVLALVMAGIAMVVAGVTAAIVTPRAEHHDH